MLSITVRPREENFDKAWEGILIKYFKKKDYQYIVGFEKNNHLQIALKTSARSNNMRRTITGLLEFTPEDEAEKSCWLKIVSHANPKYLMGYCTKELVYATNFTQEEVDESIKYYVETRDKIKVTRKMTEWICTSINSLMLHVYEYQVANGLDHFCFTSIVALMCASNKLPFSLARKVKPTDNAIYEMYVNLVDVPDRSLEEHLIRYENNVKLLSEGKL